MNIIPPPAANSTLTPPQVLRPATYEELFDYSTYPIKEVDGKVVREAYGMQFPGNPCDAEIEMYCAGIRLKPEAGGLGEMGHFKKALMLLYPYMKTQWTYWDDAYLECFLKGKGTNTILASAGSGKSYRLGTWVGLWQACSPLDRGALIVNTTQKSQSERTFGYIQKLYIDFPWLPGTIEGGKAEPEVAIYKQVNGKKTKVPQVGIITQTVKLGSTAKATQDLKGMHPKNFMVIVEESNHLNRAALERARSNWITNNWYKIILVGNPEISDTAGETAGEDSLYHFSEPIHGWAAITWGETDRWINKWQGTSYHFDPYNSPAIKYPGKYSLSTWLPTQEYLDEKALELGGTESGLFKQQIRAIYDHASLPYSPITRTMIERFNGSEEANFTGLGRQRYAAFDPAYSGTDEAFLKIAEVGFTEEGRTVISFLGSKSGFSFVLDAASAEEPSFQMLKWVEKILKEWEVPFENFVMDANVIGIGLGDIFTRFLSPNIHKVNVMGKPTDRYMDIGESITAKDKCANRASELWVGFQQLLISDQIRGLDESIIKQLVEMPAETLDSGKIKTMPKKEFRKRFGYSPDRAEVCLFIADLVRQKGLKQTAGVGGEDLAPIGRTDIHQNMDSIFVKGGSLFANNGPVPYTHSQPEPESPWDFGNIDSLLEGLKKYGQ